MPVAMICVLSGASVRAPSAIPAWESQMLRRPDRTCRSDVAAIPMITRMIPAAVAQMIHCS